MTVRSQWVCYILCCYIYTPDMCLIPSTFKYLSHCSLVIQFSQLSHIALIHFITCLDHCIVIDSSSRILLSFHSQNLMNSSNTHAWYYSEDSQSNSWCIHVRVKLKRMFSYFQHIWGYDVNVKSRCFHQCPLNQIQFGNMFNPFGHDNTLQCLGNACKVVE